MDPALRAQVLKMFASVSQAVTVAEIETLLTAGRIQEAIDLTIPKSEVFAAAWVTAYIEVGTATGAWLSSETDIQVVFDQINQRAVTAMQNNSLRMVQGLNQAQRDATREALLDGIRHGVNPRQAAIQVRQSIGLTARQVRAVNNYRRALEQGESRALTLALRDKRFDRTVARSLRTGGSLSPAQITKMVNAYIRRQIKYRAEVIARTEALRSVHEGNEEMLRQAIEDGVITAEQLTRTWNTALDTRVRDKHITMQGQERPYGEPFVDQVGNLLRYPGDPLAPASTVISCRCVLSNRISLSVPSGLEISANIR